MKWKKKTIFFQNDEPQVFNRYSEKKIREKFDKFIEITKGEVEHWNSEGSGWNVKKIELFYVKIARYDPLRERMGRSEVPYSLQKMGKALKDQANIRSTTESTMKESTSQRR